MRAHKDWVGKIPQRHLSTAQMFVVHSGRILPIHGAMHSMSQIEGPGKVNMSAVSHQLVRSQLQCKDPKKYGWFVNSDHACHHVGLVSYFPCSKYWFMVSTWLNMFERYFYFPAYLGWWSPLTFVQGGGSTTNLVIICPNHADWHVSWSIYSHPPRHHKTNRRIYTHEIPWIV